MNRYCRFCGRLLNNSSCFCGGRPTSTGRCYGSLSEQGAKRCMKSRLLRGSIAWRGK